MPTTSKMGIVYPSSSDLVKDGATAMGTISTTVDAKTGLVLLNTTSFSAVASQAINTVFNTNFAYYLIMYDLTAVTADGSLSIKLRNGTTDASTNYNLSGIFGSNATVSGEVSSGATSYIVSCLDAGNNGQYYSGIIELFNPFLAQRTQIQHRAQGYLSNGNRYVSIYGANHDVASSYDGYNLIASAGAISGVVKTYGFN